MRLCAAAAVSPAVSGKQEQWTAALRWRQCLRAGLWAGLAPGLRSVRVALDLPNAPGSQFDFNLNHDETYFMH